MVDVRQALTKISETIQCKIFWKVTPGMINSWHTIISEDMQRKKQNADQFHDAVDRWCRSRNAPPAGPVDIIEMMSAIAKERREAEADKLRFCKPREVSSVASVIVSVVTDKLEGRLPGAVLKDPVQLEAAVRARMDDDEETDAAIARHFPRWPDFEGS